MPFTFHREVPTATERWKRGVDFGGITLGKWGVYQLGNWTSHNDLVESKYMSLISKVFSFQFWAVKLIRVSLSQPRDRPVLFLSTTGAAVESNDFCFALQQDRVQRNQGGLRLHQVAITEVPSAAMRK